jgi:phage gp16-like protein
MAEQSKAERLRLMDIRMIKIGQAQLKWSDDVYRAAIAGQCGGKTSATELTWQERQKLIAYMKQQGFVVKSKKTTERTDDTMSKLRAMWFAMAEVGAVNKPVDMAAADAAIEGWAKRMKPDLVAVRFASAYQMRALIEAMKKWATRVGARTEA